MAQYPSRPNPQALLPPLLACLPTAAFSSRPPPDLLPLLTPILRQRVHLLSSSGSSQSWLLLLNWNRDLAAKLPALVEQLHLEPHPVSGEVEVGDVNNVQYRRLDPETLHARLEAEDFRLLPIYLWCTGDEQSGGTGWKLTELRPLEDKHDDSEWFDTIEGANESSGQISGPPSGTANGHSAANEQEQAQEEEDDSAYWAAYDRTPGRTPAKRSPVPPTGAATGREPSSSELEYFARYFNEVQPAMDPYDPSEDHGDAAKSTLNHHAPEFQEAPQSQSVPETRVNGSGPKSPSELVISVPESPVHPRPASVSSSHSVDRLERQAEEQSQAEIGIKQHISTDIKSLYRLARSAGIDRAEFERIVKTELEVLPLMDLE